jgi:hypothetical protein
MRSAAERGVGSAGEFECRWIMVLLHTAYCLSACSGVFSWQRTAYVALYSAAECGNGSAGGWWCCYHYWVLACL